MGLLKEDGHSYSELSQDLQKYGIACLENLQQIYEVREMQTTLAKDDIL